MQVLIAEHHPYASVVCLGSHAIAGDLRRRGYRVAWCAHPRTPWLDRLRRRPRPLVVNNHPDGVVEVSLNAHAPHVDLPLVRSAFWNRRWVRRGEARQRLAAAGVGIVDLLWINDFTQLPLLDLVAARQTVFRVFDQLDQFRWMPKDTFRHIHGQHHRADLVMASSRVVQDRLAAEGIEAMHLPNGANLSGFDRSPAVSAQRGERAVYVGALGPWFDLSTVEAWAEALPEVEFVLAGPNDRGLASPLPNVSFPGAVPRRELPALLQGAKVGLIPFHINALTRGVNPLKLYDYLAAGLPVVTSDLPAVDVDPGGVFKYASAAEGIRLVKRALSADFDRGYLYDKARANAWSGRLDEVLKRLGLPLKLTDEPDLS